MKQLILMLGLTVVGTAGALIYSPFHGVAVYYLYAVLRPQFLWEWTLPPAVRWSFYVGVAAILAIAIKRLGANRVPVQSAAADELPPWQTGTLILLAFFVWNYISSLRAVDPVSARFMMGAYAPIVAMFVASSLYLSNVRQLWILAILAAGSLCYLAYDVNFKYIAWGRLDIYHGGYGGLDNNGAALMIAMGLPFCYFLWEGSVARWRWIWPASMPLIVHAVLMTYSRGAMVAVILTTPLVVLRSRRRMPLAIGLGLMMFLVPILAGDEIRDRFFSIEEHEADQSAQSRIHAWKAAIAIAADYPIMGVGPRGSRGLLHVYGDAKVGMAVHSLYFQLLADVGYVGLLLYLMLVARFLVACHRVRRYCANLPDPDTVRIRALGSAVECSFVLFAIGASFLSLETFELPYLLLLLGLQLEWIAKRRFDRCATLGVDPADPAVSGREVDLKQA